MSAIEVIARGLLMDGGRVLLCRSVKGGYYYLPGGHVEFGEAAGVALAREFKEECGVQVDVGTCGLVTEGVFMTRKRQHHEVNLVFHVERRGTASAVTSAEPEIAFEWVDLAALTDLDVRPEIVRAWLVAGPRGCEFVSDVPRGT
jgi:8-oxo-dGTP diphosphatase